MSPLQISLAAMFGLTAAAALAVVLFSEHRHLLVIDSRMRRRLLAGSHLGWHQSRFARGGLHAVRAGIRLHRLLFHEHSSPQAIFPCFILPSIAYIVGVAKGMESA